MGLDYNKDIVKQKLDKLKDENKNLSPEALAEKEADLICREAVYAVYMAYHRRFPTDGKSAEAYETELRGAINHGVNRAISYFVDKLRRNPNREAFLESFQKLAAADNTGKFLAKYENEIHSTLSVAAIDKTDLYTRQGDEYVKGLFAPKTQSGGMLFEGLTENNTISVQTLKDAQAKTDSVTIDVPEGMNESLVTYAVMGEFFKPESLKAAEDDLFTDGSTLMKQFSLADNAIGTFFENTIIDEPRANMHSSRLILPKVRESAKKIIEGGDRNKLDDNLKNAFDTLYSVAASTQNVENCKYAFAIRHALKLAQEAKTCGRELKALGITEEKLEQLRIMQKVVDFQLETERMRNTLRAKAEKFYFSGYAPEHDELMKSETRELVLNISARDDVIAALKNELIGYHKMHEFKKGSALSDMSMSGRKTTALEKRLFEDEKGLVQESLKYVKSGEPIKEFNQRIESPEGRFRLLSRNISAARRYSDRIPLPVFVAEAQEEILNSMESYLRGKPGAEASLEALEDVRRAAAGVKPDSSLEEYDRLIAPYKALDKATAEFKSKFTYEQSMQEENLVFVTASDKISELLRALDENPLKQKAQEEHERSRAALLKSQKSERRKYDHNKADERLEAYKKAHPNASRNDINKAEIDIVAEEIMIYSRLEAFEKFDPDGRDVRKFRQLEQDIRSGGKAFREERMILSFLDDDKEKLRFATAYQVNLEARTDAAGVKGFDNTIARLSRADPADDRNKVENAREDIFNALFAPKTEHGGIRMDGFDVKGKTTQEDILKWQKQADDIVIPVPRGMDSSLVKFMVLGRTLQNDLLLKASEINKEDGSTLPDSFRPEESEKVTFWENLMKNDARINTHSIRSVVPEARQDVKRMLENKDNAGIKDCLKNAFDRMYDEIVGHSDRTKHTWYVPMQQMGRFLTALEKSSISAHSLGIDPAKLEQYEKMKPTLENVKKLSAVNAEIKETMFSYFGSGFRPEHGLKGNGRLRGLFEKKAGLEYGLKCMESEQRSYLGNFSEMPQDVQDNIERTRGLMPNEKICGESPEAFDELMGRKVKSEINNKIGKVNDSPDDVLLFCSGNLNLMPPAWVDQSFCEKNTVIPQLEKMQALLNKETFNSCPNIDAARQQMAELVDFRKANGDDYSLERIKTFVEPYQKMSDTLSALYDTLPKSIQGDADGNALGMAKNSLTIFADHIMEEEGRMQAEQADKQELAEIKGGMLPAFVERYEAYRAKLEELGTISGRATEFNAIRQNMDSLNQKLRTLCADSNTLLTRSAAQEVKTLYTAALQSASVFVSEQNKTALEDDRVFMATEIGDLLSNDLELFDGLTQSNALSMTEAVRNTYAKPRKPATINASFRKMADKLEEVGSRVGGNSDEFRHMKDALDAVKNNGASKDNLKALEESTQAYLTAKKIVPFTQKGKARLRIARDIRELCTELRIASKWEYSGFRQPDRRSYTERLGERLKAKENAALAGVKLAFHTKNDEQLKSKLAEVLYLHNAEKKLQERGEQHAERLTEAEMQNGIAGYSGNMESIDLMRSGFSNELQKALNAPDAGERIERLYQAHIRDNTRVVAERAGNRIPQKGPQLNF